MAISSSLVSSTTISPFSNTSKSSLPPPFLPCPLLIHLPLDNNNNHSDRPTDRLYRGGWDDGDGRPNQVETIFFFFFFFSHQFPNCICSSDFVLFFSRLPRARTNNNNKRKKKKERKKQVDCFSFFYFEIQLTFINEVASLSLLSNASHHFYWYPSTKTKDKGMERGA